MSSIAFSKLRPTLSIVESWRKKSGATFSISDARLSCMINTYVKIPGRINKGRIKTDNGRFNNIEIVANTNSRVIIKIMSMDKNLDAPIKIAPLSIKSCTLDN